MNNYLSKKISDISFASIVLVVLLHSASGNEEMLKVANINGYVQNLLSNGISRIAVPIFFITSGFLFFSNLIPSNKCFIDKYKSRFKSLVIPFLFWSITWDLFYYVLSKMPYISKMVNWDFKLSIMGIINIVLINPKAYQLWFVSDLIIYVILTPLIYICINKFSYKVLIPFFILWILNINIGLNSEGLLFFLCGAYISIKKIGIRRINDKTLQVLTWIWIILLIAKTYIFMNNFNNLFHKLFIVLGIVIIWTGYDSFFKFISKQRHIVYMSNFTFFIFVTHEPILTLVKKLLELLTKASPIFSLGVYLISPVITIIICIMVGSILKKYLPSFYNFIIGGRSKKVPVISNGQ